MRLPTSSRVRALQERAERQHERIAELERELKRVSPQLAALEEHVEDLRQRLDVPDLDASDAEPRRGPLAGGGGTPRARSVRARISAATVFEERLRVLEEQAGIDSATGRRRSP